MIARLFSLVPVEVWLVAASYVLFAIGLRLRFP